MMHGHEKSDSVIVAAKPANKAERSAAELVEPRAETKGNAGWQSTLRTQSRACGSQALGRMRAAFAIAACCHVGQYFRAIATGNSIDTRPATSLLAAVGFG